MDHDAGGDDEVRQIHAQGRHHQTRAGIVERPVFPGDRQPQRQLKPAAGQPQTSTGEEAMPTTANRKFPVLSTRRLTLRAATPRDVSAFRALLSVPDVTRFSNWPDAPSTTQVDRFVRWMSKAHGSGKGCAWIIETSDSKA